MEELLVSDDRDALARRAIEWAMRLVGGAAAVTFDGSGQQLISAGMDDEELADLQGRLASIPDGVSRAMVHESERTVLRLRISGLTNPGTLIVLAGPFTPTVGSEEVARVQQFMSAFVTALDRRHLIVQLKESNLRLLEASKHKSVFLASMSHELRTPLNAILGFSELLLDSDNGQFPLATKRRFLEQIHSSGKHLLGLINDILDLSKIEAGQMELRLQEVSVGEVIHQVLNTIEPLAVQKKVSITLTDGDAGSITADAGKLKQMLLNLLSNAVKFTPEGGTVTVR